MRKDIHFRSQGLNCSGWLFIPDGLAPDQKVPAVVMAHGFSGVKEMGLAFFAERFAKAGFVSLAFDYRFFGDSEGEPRGQVFPLEQVEDYRNAITWLSDQPQVDASRLGIWGTSYSGRVCLHVGLYDSRVKAIAIQVAGAYPQEESRLRDPHAYEALSQRLLHDRISRYRTGSINYIKVVSNEDEPRFLSTADSYQFYMEASKTAPNWRNQVTVESLEKGREFDPANLIHLISPTPLLIVVAEHDSLIPTELVLASYERARQPKSLVKLPCGHFEVYGGVWGDKAATAATEWFEKYLLVH